MPARHTYSPGPFGVTLARLMVEHGVTFRGLADWAELSAGYVHHLTTGNRPVPANPVIERIAAALRVEPSIFLEYRVRAVCERLGDEPATLDKLYRSLVIRGFSARQAVAV